MNFESINNIPPPDMNTIRKKLQDNAKTCVGPLKMRATRDGTTYTVNVCTSALQYGDDGEGHMPTHIKRT